MTLSFDPATLTAVEWIWGAALLLVLLIVVPLVLTLVNRLMRAAWSIEKYARASLQAAAGISRNTASITALGDTIAVAGQILEVAASIDRNCAAIENLLTSRIPVARR